MTITPQRILLFIAGLFAAGLGATYYGGVFDQPESVQAQDVAGTTSENATQLNAPAVNAEPSAPGAAEAEADDAAALPEAATEADDAGSEEQPDAAASVTEAAAPDVIGPAFDLLRVDPDGSLVIVGHADPNSSIEIVSGSSVLARTEAGLNGDFVAVLDRALKPGEHTVVLRSTSSDNVAATSPETAIVLIPSSSEGEVVALVQQPGAPSRLITVPEAQPEPKSEPVTVAEAQIAAASEVNAAEQPQASVAETSGESEPVSPVADSNIIAAEPQDQNDVAGEAVDQQIAQTSEAEVDAAEVDATVEAESETNLVAEAPAEAETPAEVVADAETATETETEEAVERQAEAMPQAEPEVEQAAEIAPEPQTEALTADEAEAEAEPEVPEAEAQTAETGPTAPAQEAAEADTQPVEADAPKAIQNPYIEAVEIDGRQIFVAGRAEPGKRVRVYVNDVLLGQTTVESSGRFLIQTERDLPVGDYIVRVDVLGADGVTVVARAAVPFARQPGENMTSVAAEVPAEAPAGIQAAPTEETSSKPVEQLTENNAVAVTETTHPALEPVDGAVIIRKGDTLWHISRRVYGHGIRYTTIYRANTDQIRNPDMIWPGQIFALPVTNNEGEAADLSAIGDQAVSPEVLPAK